MKPCEICHGTGWVCEDHPSEPWEHADCGGAGARCHCNPHGLVEWREVFAETVGNDMTLEEARRIVANEDASDPIKALEAVAMLLRFKGIAEPRLLPVADALEAAAREFGDGDKYASRN